MTIIDEPGITRLTNDQLAACYEVWQSLLDTGPEHFDMSYWYAIRRVGPPSALNLMDLSEIVHPFSDCGTTACLAGHAVVALQLQIDDNDMPATFTIHKLLGMDVQHEGFKDPSGGDINWFFIDSWPKFAADAHDKAYRRRISAYPERGHAHAQTVAQWTVVTDVLDDLVHGRRLHWYDGERYEPSWDDD